MVERLDEEEDTQMKKVRRGFIGVAVVMVVFILSAAPVLAFDMRGNDAVAVGSGEVVNEDLYLAGRTVLSNAVVNADVFAAGQTVTIGGMVANGLTAAGQTVSLTGDVGHGVRVAGSTVDISGSIGRDVLAACATLNIFETSVIAGDVAIGAGTAILGGQVGGDVHGGAETLIIEGSIAGDVTVNVGTLEVKPGATIGGNLTYTGSTEAIIPAGVVNGSVEFTERVEDDKTTDGGRGWRGIAPLAFFAGITWQIIMYLMAFITGLVLILIAPRRMAAAASVIRTETGPVAGYGAIALFAVPFAALVLVITVVGLPLGIITILLWGILLYLSQLPVSLFLGHLILGRNKSLEGKGFMIGSLALGLLVLALLKWIPFLGVFVSLAIALFGMGAFVVTCRRWMQSHRAGDDFTSP
jgi:hypothetical protein